MQTGLSYDDVLLIPQYSEVKTRHKLDISSALDDGIELSTPVIASPMDTVTGTDMCIALHKEGGLGILHRYNTIDEQLDMYLKVQKENAQCGFAIGVSSDYMDRLSAITHAGAELVCIDVAHGHHVKVKEAIKKIRSVYKKNIHIMAGNVASPQAFVALSEWGADSIRVGIGGGATCSTRIVTGHGMPNFSAVMACAHSSGAAKIVADGGIKNSGDMVKAFAAGADVVMLGTALAGTAEAPGEIVNGNGVSYKKIRGMASKEAQSDWRGRVSVAEGVSHQIPYKGELAKVLHELKTGLKSGLSYSGCSSLSELHSKAEFVMQTSLGAAESKPHIYELFNG